MTIPNKLQITSNWSTLEDKPLTRESLAELFANSIPCVRHKGFLSPKECERMVEIVHETKFASGARFLLPKSQANMIGSGSIIPSKRLCNRDTMTRI